MMQEQNDPHGQSEVSENMEKHPLRWCKGLDLSRKVSLFGLTREVANGIFRTLG